MGQFVDMLKQGAKKIGSYALGGGMGFDLINNTLQLGTNYLQGLINQKFAEQERAKNFEWNERAAQAADNRQRAQYQDLYSPEAMLQQYKAAGLSTSMMMSGGAPVTGGTAAGNMSAGTSGAYPSAGSMSNPLMGVDMMKAITDLKGQEIENSLKEIQKNMDEITAAKMQEEYNILKLTFWNPLSNSTTSIGDFARSYKNFDSFKKALMELELSSHYKNLFNTEIGERTLRSIFMANKEMSNDIAVLSSSKMNAQVMEKVSRLLYNSDYAEQNKEATINQLKQVSESAELTATQKQAFNNLIAKLGDGTFKDIIIVLLMVLSNFQQSSMKLNFGGESHVSTKNYNHNYM